MIGEIATGIGVGKTIWELYYWLREKENSEVIIGYFNSKGDGIVCNLPTKTKLDTSILTGLECQEEVWVLVREAGCNDDWCELLAPKCDGVIYAFDAQTGMLIPSTTITEVAQQNDIKVGN